MLGLLYFFRDVKHPYGRMLVTRVASAAVIGFVVLVATRRGLATHALYLLLVAAT